MTMSSVNVTNLPTKASMKPIFGHVHEYGYRIEDEQGFEVCFI